EISGLFVLNISKHLHYFLSCHPLAKSIKKINPMQSIKSTLLLLFTLFFSSIFYAQETPTEDNEKLSLTEGTLDNQFDYVIKESNEWHRDYKVIKINWLTTLKAHTLDSLKIYKVDISEKQTVIDSQAKEIESLKSNLSITKTSLDDTRAEKDNMSL